MRNAMLFTLTALALGSAYGPVAHAATDFSFDANCTEGCQAAFEGVVDDLGAALNYKPLAPAEPDGLLGFSIGAFANYTSVENGQAWNTLTGNDVTAIGMAGLSATKGLPLGFDVGAFYSAVPNTSASVYGAELRYAIWSGGVASPALAVRGAYTATSGIDDFDYAAYSADVSISKGFALITPYLGGGLVWARATPKGELTESPANLVETESNRTRFYVGARLSLALLEITPEYARQGANNSYSLRLGFGF